MEGFVGATTEDTIRNLSQIVTIGMSLANDTMLNIMIEKSSGLTDSEESMILNENNLIA
jgi:hypothetical protein